MKTIESILEAIEQHNPATVDWTLIQRASVVSLVPEDWETVRAYKDGHNEIINTLSNEEKHMFLSWVLMSEGRM